MPRIDEIVQKASDAIGQAAEVLARHGRGEDSDSPATKALIWLNALVFQELLATHLDMSLLAPRASRQVRSAAPTPLGPPPTCNTSGMRFWTSIGGRSSTLPWRLLRATPGSAATRQAVAELIRTAREIVESGMIRRHDVAGRVFHRLLDSRKFLATNYTTIPAAILIAGLAFERGPRWSKIDFASSESVAGLRIVDPACGSGTLLMAAAQEVLKRSRRAGASAEDAPTLVRKILEDAIYGFDVVPAAIHLAASTLCMAEARQVVKDMNLWRVPSRCCRRCSEAWKPRLPTVVAEPGKCGPAQPLRR